MSNPDPEIVQKVLRQQREAALDAVAHLTALLHAKDLEIAALRDLQAPR